MDPINGIERLRALLRARVERSSGKREASRTAHGQLQESGAGERAAAGGLSGLSRSQLKDRIRDRLTASGVKEASGPQANRLFVETILLWEFGDEFAADPEFAGLVAQVVDAMQADERTRTDFQRLIQSLLR